MIRFNHFNFRYEKSKKGLKDFNLQIKEGKTYGLLGKNGSGKTTLIRALTGLIIPQSGYCQIDHHRTDLRSPEMLQEISMVPEEYYFPPVSLSTYLKYWSNFYPRFDFDLIKELLEKLSFPDAKNLEQLSQGEKKKFIIAFALATRANLLIFDEPTNGLDITSKLKLKNIIHLYKKKNQSMVISTHQVKDIENLVDEIIVIDQGFLLGTFAIDHIKEKFIIKLVKKKPIGALFFMESVDGYTLLEQRKRPVDPSSIPNVDLEFFFTAFSEKSQEILKVLN